MKTRIAAVLSISGVLVAGSAAAMVNTQVLDDKVAASPTITAASTSSAPTDSSVPEAASSTSVSSSSTTTSVVPVTSVPTSASGTQVTYQVGDAGTVTLDTVGDVLTIVDVVAGSGWTIDEAEIEGPLEVEIKFESATTEVKFRAALLFGVVSTSVETELVEHDYDDDHDDDDYDEVDHDDDDHDDDDHDDHDLKEDHDDDV